MVCRCAGCREVTGRPGDLNNGGARKYSHWECFGSVFSLAELERLDRHLSARSDLSYLPVDFSPIDLGRIERSTVPAGQIFALWVGPLGHRLEELLVGNRSPHVLWRGAPLAAQKTRQVIVGRGVGHRFYCNAVLPVVPEIVGVKECRNALRDKDLQPLRLGLIGFWTPSRIVG